jgi:hypothetical protein
MLYSFALAVPVAVCFHDAEFRLEFLQSHLAANDLEGTNHKSPSPLIRSVAPYPFVKPRWGLGGDGLKKGDEAP